MEKLTYTAFVILFIAIVFACAWMMAAGTWYEVPWYDVDPLMISP